MRGVMTHDICYQPPFLAEHDGFFGKVNLLVKLNLSISIRIFSDIS